jgi:phosphatidylinositol alpha-1,6-mannosyltransferase
MKTLFVTSQFHPLVGGVPSVYNNLCRHLGDTAAVLTERAPGGVAADPSWDAGQPYPIRRIRPFASAAGKGLPKPFSTAARYFGDHVVNRALVRGEFGRAVADFRPDAVCIGTLFSAFWLVPAAHACRLPVVFYIHAEEVCGAAPSRLDGNAPKLALPKGAAVIAVSRFTRDMVVGLGVEPERVHLIPNGVDTRRFSPGPKDPALVARYGLEGKRVLMTLARLDERKGQDRLLQALPAILRERPDTVYVIAGAGKMRERLERLAADLKVSGQVVFTGGVADEELAAHYRLCDVYAMPNRTLESGDSEGFGLVFLEAGACARPVIGGKAGGVPDAVEDGRTGLLVDGNSVDEIARAAITLLGDAALAQRMGEAGLRHAAANDWSAKADSFTEVIAQAVQQPRRQGSRAESAIR